MNITDYAKAIVYFPVVIYYHILDSFFGIDVSVEDELTGDDIFLDGIDLRKSEGEEDV